MAPYGWLVAFLEFLLLIAVSRAAWTLAQKLAASEAARQTELRQHALEEEDTVG